METLTSLTSGFDVALMPVNLLYCFLGVLLGTLIGVLPGIGSLAAISMLMPVSFYLEPATAIIMLAGVYYGAEYGGSIASILLNLPGTPSAAVTALDGNALAKQGRAGPALFTAMISSFWGGLMGMMVMVVFAPWLAEFALAFGPTEYFAIMALGLVAAVAISQGSLLKGFMMVTLGLMLGVIGTDPNTAQQRFTVGQLDLADGISLVAIAMGLFGVSEVIASIASARDRPRVAPVKLGDMLPDRTDLREIWPAMLRGAGFGSFFGALPGTGATIAAFIAYAVEKRVGRRRIPFGKGAIAGVAAPESANNSAAQTAFIPPLTLGVPGSASMAVMLGALMIHGLLPGPRMITDRPDVFWGLIASFIVGNMMLLVLNIPLINIWVRLLRVPYALLYPLILVFIAIGVYSIRNSLFDVGLVAGFGLLGYAMRLLDYEPAPLLMGFVLGPLMEENLRRALVMSRGDAAVFVENPISAVILGLTVLIVLAMSLSRLRGRRSTSSETPS
ncbi:tripartite tricarboxylate transporter permease [Nitratireductor indicus]|uniref:tripartite tricarboxylate transporter permease n=1 Tax=Nitratireductor indicus TaxID=721133 RepID=UPI0028760DC1|nr:tripartite tricarboxylate transporter permease [Nitratireductor indicus]MDS1138772.1 tripartite tricarboxylate transporter permease [Nitratireductor indicus]